MKTRESATKTGKIIQRLMSENSIDDLTRLSDATGVPQPTLHRILYVIGREPRSSTLKPIADFFGVSVPQLRGEEFYSPKPPHLRISVRAERVARNWDRLPPRMRDCIEALIESVLEHRSKTAQKHS